MNKAEVALLKSTLQRLADVLRKYVRNTTEPSGPLSSTTTSPTEPPNTNSPLEISSGSKRKKNKKQKSPKDYAYGQRGKNEAGKTQRGITSLPTEPTITRTPPTDNGTPYAQ